MAIVNVNQENFHSEVLESDKKVLLDFWASWCGPCRMVAPILDAISQEREDIKVCKINIDENPELANRFAIMTIPTLMVLQDGQVINKASGARPKDAILALL